MPSLGADMEAGTLIQWLIKPGDAVKRGDIIAVVDTEKAAIEIEVFDVGVIQTILVHEGEKVPVGTVLALIRTDGETMTPTPPLEVRREVAVSPPVVVPTPAPPPPTLPRIEKPSPLQAPQLPSGRLHISPLAMRTAIELGVDLTMVKGTGPGGAITKADVQRIAATKPPPTVTPARAPAPPAPPVEEAKVVSPAKPVVTPADRHAAMRRAIAAAMARSKREIPHYYLGTRIEMGRALTWLQTENLKRPVTERLLSSVLLLKAVAVAVHEIPEMNGFWVEGGFKPSEAVHVGVAISLRQGGLIAPAIHDLDKKSLDEIMVNLRDLVKRVRAGVLRSSEIAEATITVTSLGDQGVETVFGIIYPPQVALVGFGKVTEQPWAVNGMVGAKSVVMATLAADHRASDGHRGGLFLAAINRMLQEPEKL
jgi:pyruvate dehydrogenase E2 component (dihydrolipoamide acetyltransferase)